MIDHFSDEQEQWVVIEEFPTYSISSFGRVFNHKYEIFMRTNLNNYGNMKITLTDEETGERFDRSVPKLVAEAFVEPPNSLCNQIVILDGDFTNVIASNLVWRPSGFAYRYTRQLKEQQPVHFYNLPILNVTTRDRYVSVIHAGMSEGLLFEHVWRSTYTKLEVFPQGYIFEVSE